MKRISRFVQYIVVAFFAMFCCISCMKQEKDFLYELRVCVVDEGGNPISDAEVSLRYNKTGQSDYQSSYRQEGYYSFTGLTQQGPYQVWAHKRGNEYKDDFTDVRLEENKVERVNLKLIRL